MIGYLSKFKMFTCAICFLALLLSTSPSQSEAAIISTQPANALTHGKTWQQMSVVEKVQTLCAISAVIAFLVAEVWFIVAGFKTSVGWGLFMLFIGGMRSIGAVVVLIGWMIRWTIITRQSEPFHLPITIAVAYVVFAGCGAVIFIVRHWEQARKPLAVMGLGILLILALLGLGLVK
jgi:hypothetical protein